MCVFVLINIQQIYKKFNTYSKKFAESKIFNIQEKYNKKLLTMKMLKTQNEYI